MIEALVDNGERRDSPFGPHEEHGVISLIIDFPELYLPVARFLTPDLFSEAESKYVMASIQQDFDKFGVIPSRKLLHDRLAKSLTVDDPHEPILGLVDRPSDPREVPMLRQTLRTWTEHQTFDLLYTDEAIAAHHRGDHEFIRKIVDSAGRINSVGKQGFWFFDQIEELFADNVLEHIPTGFKELDKLLNDGGPSPKEVLVYLAPTGVGKTLIMINSAYAAMKAGHNVMFVTFELSTLKTAMRLAAALAGIELSDFTKPNVGDLPPSELDNLRAKQATVRNRVQKASTTCGSLVIYELPPAECSIDDIYGIIENNKKLHGWVPKVVVLDYLELMLSRHDYNNNRGDYARQQNVAMEMRGLANNENVFVYTATQTNRGAITENQQEHIDVNKIAESFGKAMPVDYVVSLNQTQDEYKRGLEPKKKGEQQTPSVIRLWIAKNRNGPKFVSVTTNVFYGRMQILEIE